MAFYYNIALVQLALKPLTYRSTVALKKGDKVTVPLKGERKYGVVLEEVAPPDFETEEIEEDTPQVYAPFQLDLARFISEYYFSSIGEALGLFLPFPKDKNTSFNPVESKRPHLTPAQQAAYKALSSLPKALLFGVTGAGKTEVLIARMADMLAQGKTCLFLMPEISLTPQMEKRLKRYFGDAVALWHSKITKKKKEAILDDIAEGKVRIVAGARSALFVPLPNLGLIVVDEEHDDSYKAQTRPRYHARDVAVLTAQKRGAQVILASATPSVSSYYKYDVVRLDTPYKPTRKRYRFIAGEGISAPVVYAVRECIEEGGQALVFLPTRGNFKYLYCPSCGKTHTCPYCSVGMALHRKQRCLKCHYCNYTEAIRETCAYCGHMPLSSERIGTQEAVELLQHAIEGIRIERLDRDSITTARKLERALQRFAAHEADVLLGTQMLAKGHDYANITLSVILGLDHIAGMGDYRAKERAVSLFFQIAGRSGRAKEAEVLVQTADASLFEPYIGDYETFLKEELLFREFGNYPPFVSLARILIAHKEERKAETITEQTVAQLRRFEGIEIVGYGKAPIERIAGKYRYSILLRAKKRTPLLYALHAVNRKEIEIDMDPVEFS